MSGILDMLREEHASLTKLEADGYKEIQDLAKRVQTTTTKQHAEAISMTRCALHRLCLFVLYIQNCDTKLLELPAEDVATASNISSELVLDQEGLQKNIEEVCTPFEDASEALDRALHEIQESEELLTDFQYATEKPLKARTRDFLDNINSAQRDIMQELESSETQLNEVRRKLNDANSEKVVADKKVDKRGKAKRRLTKVCSFHHTPTRHLFA
jgi:hypothetical protein